VHNNEAAPSFMTRDLTARKYISTLRTMTLGAVAKYCTLIDTTLNI